MTLVKYEPKAGKQVHMLSTIHHAPLVADDATAKPLAILDYNKTKVDVDILDQLAKEYSTVRGCRRWTMRLFAWLLDVACVSANTAFKLANGEELDGLGRRQFLQELATALLKPMIRRRELDSRIRPHIRRMHKIVVSIRSQEQADPGLDESTTLQAAEKLVTTPRRLEKRRRSERDLSIIHWRNRPYYYVTRCKKRCSRVCKLCRNALCTDHSDMRMREGRKEYFCGDAADSYCIRDKD